MSEWINKKTTAVKNVSIAYTKIGFSISHELGIVEATESASAVFWSPVSIATVSCEGLSKQVALEMKKPPYIPIMLRSKTKGAILIASDIESAVQVLSLEPKNIFIVKTINNKSGKSHFKGFDKISDNFSA